MTLQAAITLTPAQLHENGRTPALVSVGGGNDYYDVGNGAYWEFTTSARYAELDGYATAPFGVGGVTNRICARTIQGGKTEDRFFKVPEALGAFTAKLLLPAGTNKTVQIFVPAQYAMSGGAAPVGVYPIRVRFDAAATAVAPVLLAKHVVIYGDSIASGGVGVCPTLFGYAGLMKRPAANGGYDGSVTLVSHGYRRLLDDCDTAPKRTAFASFLVSLNPTKIILAIGSNDQAVPGGPNLASFTAYYGGLLDAIHAIASTIPVVCSSPIIRDETATTNGWTMPQGRTAIAGEVTARAGWSVPPVYMNGLPICTLSDLPDGTHPGTTTNETKMLPAFLAVA
jgi:hypothetical protein